jgi:hypothetical protein
MRDEDEPEYERIKRELVTALKKYGGYEPAVDDLHVDSIARATICSKRAEAYLDSDVANEHTYTRVADVKVKLSSTVENALRQLAINRQDRLAGQTEKGIRDQLRESILRAVKNARR